MCDALKEQLKELNSRSRWYSSQLWYIPFAYFSLVAVTLANVINKQPSQIGIALIACGVLGIFVIWHMCLIMNGEKRAIKHLKDVEEKLSLDSTVEEKPYSYPFLAGVVVVTINSLVFGILLSCRCGLIQ